MIPPRLRLMPKTKLWRTALRLLAMLNPPQLLLTNRLLQLKLRLKLLRTPTKLRRPPRKLPLPPRQLPTPEPLLPTLRK